MQSRSSRRRKASRDAFCRLCKPEIAKHYCNNPSQRDKQSKRKEEINIARERERQRKRERERERYSRGESQLLRI